MSTNTLMEFNEIKKKWGEYAVTESAKERINAAAPILNEDELRKELRDTDEARDFVDRFGFPPLTSVHEAKEIMEIACKEGCLLPIQLEKIRNVLVSVKRLKAYLSRGVDYDNSLAYYELNLESMDELCEEIEVQIRGEEVDDRASAELRKLIVGEAGESCAFFIAEKLGMPDYMLDNAKKAAYGDCQFGEVEIKRKTSRVKRHKIPSTNVALSQKFNIGDSVYVMPYMKIGIVCEPVNEEGILRVQIPDGKIYINHKRVKLNVPAQQLYPEDYDFSIIFDSVENRKLRHDMGRKFTKGKIIIE